MKTLKVLFIDNYISDYEANYKYGMSTNHIEAHEISMFEIKGYDFTDIDCIVYGYTLYEEREFMFMLPAHIPRVIYTSSPSLFKKTVYSEFDTIDPVIHKHGNIDSLKDRPEYPNNFICRPELIVLANKIRSVCKRKSKVRKFEKGSQPYLQPTISVCERNNNFIGRYFEDVLDYVITNYLKWAKYKIVNKVSDNRYVINMQDETDRTLFQQNIKGLKLLGYPIYPDDYKENHYLTVTYYSDNDKIIVKEVRQQILWRHVLKNNPGQINEWEYVKEKRYYKSDIYKCVITRQGVLNCHANNFRRMAYYSYANNFLGTAINSSLFNPEIVFNRILKDINLSYRPDMEWTYFPTIYQEIANSITPLKLAKKLNKICNPNVSKGMIDALVEEHRIEENKRLEESWEKYHKSVDVDDLPF